MPQRARCKCHEPTRINDDPKHPLYDVCSACFLIMPAAKPADALTVVHDNGDKHTVKIVSAKYASNWKFAKGILIVKWGELCGEYAIDSRDGKVYAFGKGGGLRRTPTAWTAQNPSEVRATWIALIKRNQEAGR